MAKYKDVEPILAKLEEFAQSTCDSSYEDGIRIAMQVINETHTADVQEVKHGKWIGIPHKMYSRKHGWEDIICEYKCSICGNVQDAKYFYCSYCGAKMDGKEGE